MNNIKFLLIGTSLSFLPQLTFAQCVATQDCETLGYTETSCNGGKGVKCPFGNKWACLTSEEECLNLACDKLGFIYTCNGIGYSSGSGTACNGKYTYCSCASGYEWNGNGCQPLNGAQGDLYYCNGTVVGVKANGMDFYVAMKDLGDMNWNNADSQCKNYNFCNNLTGILPTETQLLTIYNNKSQVNSLLSTHGGTLLTNDYYWSSTTYPGNHSIINISDGEWFYGGPNNMYYVRPVLASY